MDESEDLPSYRQQEVLDFILAHLGLFGIPPSLREIGAAFGMTSTNAVSDHVNALIRKGYLERAGRGRPRSLRVTPKARAVVTENVLVVPMLGLPRRAG